MFEIIDKVTRKMPDNKFFNFLISKYLIIYYFFIDRYNISKQKKKYQTSKNPLISIYIPTFNRSNLLCERAIPSILSQTYRNFELIIVDDGSTDDTEIKVKSFKDKRIKYFKNSRDGYRYPNKSIYHWYAGPVLAANLALEKIKGEWIARNDDDDIWTNDHLEKLLNFALLGDYDLVSSDYKVSDEEGSRIISAFDNPKDYTKIGSTNTWLYKSYLKCVRYNIHCWRKNYFRVNDTDLSQRFYFSGIKTGYLEEVTTIMFPRPGENVIGSKAYLKEEKKYEKFYS